jgi:hypothetical protein
MPLACVGAWKCCHAGRPAPPLAELLRDRRRVHTGVLAVQLLRTSLVHTKVQRPQVMMQLDHLDGRQELRRTGVRERWARRKATLRHGIVDWRLKFTFCVDTEADAAACEADLAGRFLQVWTWLFVCGRFCGLPFRHVQALCAYALHKAGHCLSAARV